MINFSWCATSTDDSSNYLTYAYCGYGGYCPPPSVLLILFVQEIITETLVFQWSTEEWSIITARKIPPVAGVRPQGRSQNIKNFSLQSSHLFKENQIIIFLFLWSLQSAYENTQEYYSYKYCTESDWTSSAEADSSSSDNSSDSSATASAYSSQTTVTGEYCVPMTYRLAIFLSGHISI